jgi:hypothetical protein
VERLEDTLECLLDNIRNLLLDNPPVRERSVFFDSLERVTDDEEEVDVVSERGVLCELIQELVLADDASERVECSLELFEDLLGLLVGLRLLD